MQKWFQYHNVAVKIQESLCGPANPEAKDQ